MGFTEWRVWMAFLSGTTNRALELDPQNADLRRELKRAHGPSGPWLLRKNLGNPLQAAYTMAAPDGAVLVKPSRVPPPADQYA